MSTPFFEVFPTLQLNEKLRSRFLPVEVQRVVAGRSSRRLKVHIESTHLLHHQDVMTAAQEIAGQLFEGASVDVEFVEHYRLSEMYTPEKLFLLYADSLESELAEESSLSASLFHQAEKAFTGERTLRIRSRSNTVAQVKLEAVCQKLKEIFEDRFGYMLDIRLELEHTDPSEAPASDADLALDQEIRRIVEAAGKAKEPGETKDSADGGSNAVSGQNSPKTASAEKKGGRGNSARKAPPKDPDIFFGRAFAGEIMPISAITDEIGEVIIRGSVFTFNKDDVVSVREISGDRTLIIFKLTDDTDTIKVKLFVKNELLPDVLAHIVPGACLSLKGMALYDKYDHEISIGSVTGIKTIPPFRQERMDTWPKKRVELHAHTMMSEMDSVADTKALVKRAAAWGHPAVAITDHGVVQAFPDANHAAEDLKTPFKVIYGVEAYLVDDVKPIVTGGHGEPLDGDCVVFDIETTGFSAVHDHIIEIGAVKVSGGVITDRFSAFVNPGMPIPLEIEQLTGITDAMVADAPSIEDILPSFLAFCDGCMMAAHNADFDMGFIRELCERLSYDRSFVSLDTLGMARALLPDLKNYKLDTVTAAMDCVLDHHHRAVDDAEATAQVYVKFLAMLSERGIRDTDALNSLSSMSVSAIQKARVFHCIILAKNETGRVNLYRLISESHLTYYSRRPRIPKSRLNHYREGLIVGSACEAGELFRALVDERSPQEIARIVDFYDYLEIQPLGNNAFMIKDPKHPNIHDMEDLKELNRQIIRLGEQFHKPVCATCDVHFMDPADELYRRLIMYGKGFEDADEQAPLYFRTTREMLDEFDYLGAEKAEEVVITNTNMIADMIEAISPVSPDKCPPVIEDSDQTLRTICYEKAHQLYGENLPEIVSERLERELNSIISNGFAVMYIIAQKLVWKSVADGYLVGSRGSVGSSLAAYMAGITEVNSLPAHYLCPSCKYVDFDSDYVRSFSGRSGCDMEDAVCPVCGQPLSKEGHDIPFETFLGFKGNKEPDIDLNFSGEYQSKAHSYTEVIFGYGQTFRAGTVGGLADKTAYGYAMHYCEDHGVTKRSCEIERMAKGCVGVRRTSGQHPGGIVVLPMGMEINTFTPVQHPANDMTTPIVTTHFDYHSIDHNLLKLDILGHDDPTMIRMLEDITGVDATSIKLDDPDVLSLFRGLDALGITPEDIGGTELGSLGVPEFGTDFAMQMLKDTHPTAFSDLARIAGLSHGTDVWLGNAQTLIQEGRATISTAICTRDDIMIYLIHKGVESETAFKIMESVRKGKGLTPDWEQIMKDHEVPDWYIWSCKKIKYMFPKAHAVAYVMMGFRIAWFKIHRPLAYYAAFFSIRATSFNYALMCHGKAVLDGHIDRYKHAAKLTPKEEATLKDMRIVQEMYARGFEFLPVDLYRSEATKFVVEDGKLRPPFSAIEGVAASAAELLYEAAKDGRFISRDEVKERSGIGAAVIETLAEAGVLDELPQSNQLSIFDL